MTSGGQKFLEADCDLLLKDTGFGSCACEGVTAPCGWHMSGVGVSVGQGLEGTWVVVGSRFSRAG